MKSPLKLVSLRLSVLAIVCVFVSSGASAWAGALETYLSGKTIDLTNPTAAKTKLTAITPTVGYPSTLSLTRSQTIDGKLNSVVVLNLTDLVLSKDVVLTLKSTNPNAVFIINVKRNFSLNSARIALQGVMQGNVLYNYVGSGAPSITGTSKLTGTLLSTTSTLVSGNSVVSGSVVGAAPKTSGTGFVAPSVASR